MLGSRRGSLLDPDYPMWVTVMQGLVLHLVLVRLAPPLLIHAMVPIVLCASMRMGVIAAAYVAVACGLLVDLLTTTTPLGFFAIGYWLIALATRTLRTRLDQEQWGSLWAYITLWTIALGFVYWFGALIAGIPLRATWTGLAQQLLIGPLANGAVVSLWFGLPAAWKRSPRRKRRWSRS
jgi:hypothetical protein